MNDGPGRTAATASGSRSRSPTEDPPLTTTPSHSSSASAKPGFELAWFVTEGRIVTRLGAHGAQRGRDRVAIGVSDSPGSGRRSGSISSSPLESTASTGRR